MKHLYILFFVIFFISCKSNDNIERIPKTISPISQDTTIIIKSKEKSIIEDSLRLEKITPEKEYLTKEIETNNNLEIYPLMSNEENNEEKIDSNIILPFIYENSPYGDINYIMEDTMIVGKPTIVNMTISENVKRDTIIEKVSTFTEENLVTNTIRISPVMRAKLIDPTDMNFTIISITPQEQLIENNEFTKWEWSVTPLNKGNHKLKLTVDIIYGDVSKNVEVYEDFIYVYSDIPWWKITLNFIFEYWKWFVSSIFIPIGIWIYKKIRKKK